MLLAIDPGSVKCGLAVVSANGEAAVRSVIPTASLEETVARLLTAHAIDRIVMGDRTRSREFARRLAVAGLVPAGGLFFVDEHRSSEEARRRYLRDNPPRQWWLRLLPAGMRAPDRPYDDYVAVILAERFLASNGKVCRFLEG